MWSYCSVNGLHEELTTLAGSDPPGCFTRTSIVAGKYSHVFHVF